MDIHISPMKDTTATLNLMRLTSPSLPIGAYAYSQGLEFACEHGWVTDAKTAKKWISGLLLSTQTYLDIPILVRLYNAWLSNSLDEVKYWSQFLLVSRESKELYEEDHYLGKALSKLLLDLEIQSANEIVNGNFVTFATAFSLAAVRWQIDQKECCKGYLWAWSENQVNVAMKLIPLGQTDGQKILSSLIEIIPDVINKAMLLSDDNIGSTAIGLGIASANHETQYTRLFRS